MIDNESSIQEVKSWNSETRGIFKNTLTVFENGKYSLQQYRDEKAQSTKINLQEEEQEFKEVERKEWKKLRSRLQWKN